MGQIIGDLSTELNTILTLTIQNKIQLRALLHFQKKQLAKLYNQDQSCPVVLKNLACKLCKNNY